MALFTTQLARTKRNLFSSLRKKKERKTPHHRLIYTTLKKNGINLKRIWYQPYIFLWRVLQIFFVAVKI